MKKKCPRCRNERFLTQHHIIPKRLGTDDERTIRLCEECHKAIEKLIRELEYQILRNNRQIYHQAVENIKE